MAKYKERCFSFEFFPPKSEEGNKKLRDVRSQLATLNPHFCSVTYGASGSTREHTKGVVKEIHESGIAAAPHLSFGADSEEKIAEILNDYKDIGITRLVALRGDVPSGMGGVKLVYANELVEFIRAKTGDHFEIYVAAYPEIHPQATNYDTDIHYLKAKFDAGANSAITQYFYNIDAYFYFIEQCDKIGISAPIYPGIMPIINFNNLIRFSDNCGAEIPRWIRQRIEGYEDDNNSIQQFGIEIVSKMCEKLLANGIPGLHFYTMNQAHAIKAIWDNLGLKQ